MKYTKVYKYLVCLINVSPRDYLKIFFFKKGHLKCAIWQKQANKKANKQQSALSAADTLSFHTLHLILSRSSLVIQRVP